MKRKHAKTTTTLPKTTPLFYQNYKEPLKKVTEVLESGYGYMGTIATNEDKTHVQCHLCGELFTTLAGGRNGHLRKEHNMSAAEYKDKFQLSQNVALVGEASRIQRITNGTKGAEIAQSNQEKLAEGRKKYWEDVKSGKRKRVFKRTSWALDRRNIEGNCPDQLLDQIKALADKLGHTPTMAEFDRHARSSRTAVETTFGSWANAIKLLKLEPRLHWRERGPIMTEEQVLEAIRQFYVREKRTPRTSDFKRGLLPSMRTVVRYFGSVQNARRAAGVPILVNTGGGHYRHYAEVMETANA